jgi:hypothetical protein
MDHGNLLFCLVWIDIRAPTTCQPNFVQSQWINLQTHKPQGYRNADIMYTFREQLDKNDDCNEF